MKIISTIALALLLSPCLQAQEEMDTVPAGFTGVHEIVIGAKFADIKKFLDVKPVYSIAEKRQAEMSGEKAPTEEGWGKPDTWMVKKSGTKFFTYMKAPVSSIEVSFDDSNKVSHIRLLIPKTSANEALVKNGSIDKFGNTLGSMGMEGEFYFPWSAGGYRYTIANWDVLDPEPIEFEKETYIFVDFRGAEW